MPLKRNLPEVWMHVPRRRPSRSPVDCPRPSKNPRRHLAPTFRALLQHKLQVIIRAAGGKGTAARWVRVDERHFRRWVAGTRNPSPPFLDRIDYVYAGAAEALGKDYAGQARLPQLQTT